LPSRCTATRIRASDSVCDAFSPCEDRKSVASARSSLSVSRISNVVPPESGQAVAARHRAGWERRGLPACRNLHLDISCPDEIRRIAEGGHMADRPSA